MPRVHCVELVSVSVVGRRGAQRVGMGRLSELEHLAEDVMGKAAEEVERAIGWHGYPKASDSTERAVLMGFIVTVAMLALFFGTIALLVYTVCMYPDGEPQHFAVDAHEHKKRK